MNSSKIENLYKQIEIEWNKNLKKYGVSLPKLKSNGKYTKDALVLIYLYNKIGKTVTKSELTSFVKHFYPGVNDVQQARHLGQQKGWFILSGTRGDIESNKYKLKSGEYMLITLETHYPKFTNLRRIYKGNEDLWIRIKRDYNNRCATCGSEEGKPNIHYPNSLTKLQKGHKNPTKPLIKENIIPQCEKCNRADRNYYIYNNKGRVIEIANPKVVLRSPLSIQLDTLNLLIKKFPQKTKEILSGIFK